MNIILDITDIHFHIILKNALLPWKITRFNERCYGLTGLPWKRRDILRIYQSIGGNGHLYLHHLQDALEPYLYHRNPYKNQLKQPRFADLDPMTQAIIQAAEERSPFPEPTTMPGSAAGEITGATPVAQQLGCLADALLLYENESPDSFHQSTTLT